MASFYTLLLAVLTFCLWADAEVITLSAVKKLGAPKLVGDSDNILDFVEIVDGRHEDAVAVATFTNSINKTG